MVKLHGSHKSQPYDLRLHYSQVKMTRISFKLERTYPLAMMLARLFPALISTDCYKFVLKPAGYLLKAWCNLQSPKANSMPYSWFWRVRPWKNTKLKFKAARRINDITRRNRLPKNLTSNMSCPDKHSPVCVTIQDNTNLKQPRNLHFSQWKHKSAAYRGI